MKVIPFKENLIIEFKSDRKRYSDALLVEEIVGMANTKGGELYLGVEDNGEVTGLHKEHRDINGLMALIANMTVPSLSVRAEILRENDKEVLKIEIPMSKSIIATSSGKILRRRLKVDGSPENIPMYPYEINTRLSELSLLDFSGQILTGAEYEDLDPNERIRLKKIIELRYGDRTLLELSDEELDKALQLVKEENGKIIPTITGMLLIGKEEKIRELMPTAKSVFQVLEGTAVRKNEEFSKPLLETFEIFEENFKVWNPELEIETGLFRMPIPEFSYNAFREALVNAFCHRDYSMIGNVRVAITDEGMTISNPGGFIEGVNLKNLLTVEPHGRNQTLANALKRIGLAERTGRGIDRIFEGSIVYGRPWPDYSESTSTMVKVFIQRAKPDIPFIKMIYNAGNRSGKSLSINSLMILSLIKFEHRVDLHRIMEKINLSDSRAKANVYKLIEEGLIEKTGGVKNKNYILSRNIYKENDNVIGYVRQSGIDTIRNEEMILKLAEQTPEGICREDVVQLLNVTKDSAYGILKKLRKQNLLEVIGKGKGTKYILKNKKNI
ncbi:MAG: putative DNA binding domain-containing protein [Fusobacterium perfoetens]|uniref:RNA-binding domain-containing protein n=1 Tax=Fusobacterium perfoetens TaxID=852 RepID=UPI0023F18051|nr:RNA-binding domain-containing protein [Fusobacterium perfoetens]MCI6151633.1 putative DNA binding domain-containing protein [Fusobacterium perfoetens]MDY3237801.1 putative DNA binding domain-containing protein [Fusobacterium perfoetens]